MGKKAVFAFPIFVLPLPVDVPSGRCDDANRLMGLNTRKGVIFKFPGCVNPCTANHQASVPQRGGQFLMKALEQLGKATLGMDQAVFRDKNWEGEISWVVLPCKAE